MNTAVKNSAEVIDLGLIEYQQAWDYQTSIFNEILAIKAANRTAETSTATKSRFIFCEHPHVFTLGKSGDEKNLLISKDNLSTVQATYFATNRGGDITYHGPGQIVVYPVLDLENFFTDIHRYMRTLEEAVIQTLDTFGIKGGRINGLTGVWLDADLPGKCRKICAMGVKTSRWVTLHGLALNVNTNLEYFNYIVPCGITDKAVTSMEKELGKKIDMEEVKSILSNKLLALFNLKD